MTLQLGPRVVNCKTSWISEGALLLTVWLMTELYNLYSLLPVVIMYKLYWNKPSRHLKLRLMFYFNIVHITLSFLLNEWSNPTGSSPSLAADSRSYDQEMCWILKWICSRDRGPEWMCQRWWVRIVNRAADLPKDRGPYSDERHPFLG